MVVVLLEVPLGAVVHLARTRSKTAHESNVRTALEVGEDDEKRLQVI
jgi:hypothetical protein